MINSNHNIDIISEISLSEGFESIFVSENKNFFDEW